MKSSLSPAVDRHLLNRAFNQNCIKSFIKPNFPRLTCQQRKRLRLDSMAKRNSRSTEYPYGPGLYNTLFLLTELEVRIVNYGPPTIYCLCAKRAHRKSRWGWGEGGRRICNLQYRPGRRSQPEGYQVRKETLRVSKSKSVYLAQYTCNPRIATDTPGLSTLKVSHISIYHFVLGWSVKGKGSPWTRCGGSTDRESVFSGYAFWSLLVYVKFH